MTKENIFAAIDDETSAEQLPATVEANNNFEMSQAERDLAGAYGLSLDGDVQHMVQEAAAKTSTAQHMMVQAGLLLINAHAQLSAERTTKLKNANPEFAALLDECNMPKQRASELMRIARYVSTLSDEQREAVLGLGKKKILAFASTDIEVLDQLILGGEDFDISSANVETTLRRIKELEAKLAQRGVDIQKVEAANQRLERQLAETAKRPVEASDIVPELVSDIRLETAALFKKAELSIDGIARLIPEAHLLEGEWSLSTARGLFAALQGLISVAKGAAVELHKVYGADLDGDHATLERLTQKELFKCAVTFKELIGEHEHEAAMRAYERDLDKPKGKGRPKAAPKN